MKSKLLGVILAGVAFAAFGLVGTMDAEDEAVQEAHYCEMLKTFKRTNGEMGWPDYKGTYYQACLG